MNTTTWNPHRYIEYFGSKEKLQSATSLYAKAFNKALLSKRINTDIKSFLDKKTGFAEEKKYNDIPKLIEKGYSKRDLIDSFGCSNQKIIEELENRFGTRDTYIIRKRLQNERKAEIQIRDVDQDVMFAVKNFKRMKSICTYLCLSERGARHRLTKVFGTSNLLAIAYILEE